MQGSVQVFDDYMVPDQLACKIANLYIEWGTLRNEKLNDWDELRRYVFATDTTKTTNSKLPWKNKTTVPKLCQLRDNLYANYRAAIFPKRKWLTWEASSKDAAKLEKKNAIQNYMTWVTDQDNFKKEFDKLLYDYIDYGNCFATVEWLDQTVNVTKEKRIQQTYVGPIIRRISPLDIVFNPTATSFYETPKIVRSIVNIGDIKKEIGKQTSEENKKYLEDLYKYMKDLREHAFQTGSTTELAMKDSMYNVDGFSSFQNYLQSDYVEVLTFYGDIYDRESDTFYENYVFKVIDRHKLMEMKPNPSFFGTAPIFHCGWRIRQDNLWAMGPLDNLVGMQYRLDHVENLKADCFDLTAVPVLSIKGQVDDFEWGPGERIYSSDEGSVEMVVPDVNALNANLELKNLQDTMEMMAGAPKEAMGFRTPGEKTAYEVQKIENAAGRIFSVKSTQFEEHLLEPLLNAQLELACRMMTTQEVRVFDDTYKAEAFTQITSEDLVGNGRIRPIGARHFAEKSEIIQNLNNFANSALGQAPDIKMHWSGIKTSELVEQLLELTPFDLVKPYVGLMEQQEAQSLMATAQQNAQMEALTPAGIAQDDFDPEILKGGMPQLGASSPPEDNSPEGNLFS